MSCVYSSKMLSPLGALINLPCLCSCANKWYHSVEKTLSQSSHAQTEEKQCRGKWSGLKLSLLLIYKAAQSSGYDLQSGFHWLAWISYKSVIYWIVRLKQIWLCSKGAEQFMVCGTAPRFLNVHLFYSLFPLAFTWTSTPQKSKSLGLW